MKRSLFRQLMVAAFFACNLSADIPNMRKQGELAVSKAGQINKRPMSAGGLAARQAVVCLPLAPSAWRGADVRDGHARGMLACPAVLSARAMPDPMALFLSAAWPVDGFGFHPLGRACVRWDTFPGGRPEMMNVPGNSCAAAFFVPRFRMPPALPANAWPRPVGFSAPAQSSDIAVQAGGADMAAMIPRLKKIFKQEGVPQKWVWVAEVESALKPRARSSAGAAGLFQLMPVTAQRFGLRTAPVDDRMEPEKSAVAAAQYLKILRRELGCWSLALAAYNAGEGRVKEIMKTRKARTFNEVERYLPSETRAYVPKVMAIVALREDQLHGVPGASWMP